ncbi:hypothetical protein EB810_13780 [Altererythrobacter sp. FM1]|nr:hypothetical protein EB810_13780 [Altererythrobacter sp. FM1]
MRNEIWGAATLGAVLLSGAALAKEGVVYQTKGRGYGETQSAACDTAKRVALSYASNPRHNQAYSSCNCGHAAFSKNSKYKYVCTVTSYNRTPDRPDRPKGSGTPR